jgi:putative sterol carrier protein
MGELLSSSNIKGTFHLRIVEGGSVADAPVFSVNLGGAKAAKARVGAKAAAKSTVEVITTSQTWSEIASGRMAPHDAFLGGHMRVRGSVGLAQRLLKHLAGDEGSTFLCREEG